MILRIKVAKKMSLHLLSLSTVHGIAKLLESHIWRIYPFQIAHYAYDDVLTSKKSIGSLGVVYKGFFFNSCTLPHSAPLHPKKRYANIFCLPFETGTRKKYHIMKLSGTTFIVALISGIGMPEEDVIIS